MKAKDIIKIMKANNITLHDLAREENEKLFVCSLEDIMVRINEQHESTMSRKIAEKVFDRFDFCNYEEYYDTTDLAIDELVKEYLNNDK